MNTARGTSVRKHGLRALAGAVVLTTLAAAPVALADEAPTYVAPIGISAASSLVVGPGGNVSAVGFTTKGFTATPGAHDDGAKGDVAVQSIDPTGTRLWAARIGGSQYDYVDDQVVDAHGNVYLTGSTPSKDFPTTPGALGQGYWDAGWDWVFPEGAVSYVLKLSPTGRMLYAARLPHLRGTFGISVDTAGAIYVSGKPAPDFVASAGAWDTDAGPDSTADGVIVKVNPAGTAIAWSTYVGGSGDDSASTPVLTGDGSLVISGTTTSRDLPTTPGAAVKTFPEGAAQAGFLLRLRPDGRSLAWSTYFPMTESEGTDRPVLAPDGRVAIPGTDSAFTAMVEGQPTKGGVLWQFAANGSSYKRMNTPRYFGANPTSRGDIMGIGQTYHGGKYNNLALRISFEGRLISAVELPGIGLSVAGDAGSTYVGLAPGNGLNRAASRATSPPAIARFTRCTIRGTNGDDVLRGTPGPDVICGLGGHDKIYGGDGYDVLRGGSGRDTLKGGNGVDVLVGGYGADTLVGGYNRDLLQGGAGRDELYGGRGSDRLYGGGDNDLLTGGYGRDVCRDRYGRNVFRSCNP